MRRLYYLVSTAGIPNLGDELIAATWLRYLADMAPDADVVLDCIRPERVGAPLLGLHPRLRLVSALWQGCFRHWSDGERAADAVAALVSAPDQAGDLRDGMALLRRADVVHLTGGGFLNGMWPPFVGLLAGMAVAGRAGAVTAMTGVGLYPPVDEVRNPVAELATQLTVADVRDEPSARLLGSGVRHTCDDVFLSPEAWLNPRRDAPEVMVSLQTTRTPTRIRPPMGGEPTVPAAGRARTARDDRTRQSLTSLLAFAARTLADWGADEIGLVECWPEEDRPLWERADCLAPKVHRYPLDDVTHNGFPAAAGQIWLSTRFHPHLLAASAGASGVAVSLMKGYYDTKHVSLIDQGSRWSLAAYRPLDGSLEMPARPSAGGYRPEDLAGLRAEKFRVARLIYEGG